MEMEKPYSTGKLIFIWRSTRHHIPDDGILTSHYLKTLKVALYFFSSHILYFVFITA